MEIPLIVFEEFRSQFQLGGPVGIWHPTHAKYAVLPETIRFGVVDLKRRKASKVNNVNGTIENATEELAVAGVFIAVWGV